MDLLEVLLPALLALIGVAYGVWSRNKIQREELNRPDWPDFTHELREEVASLRETVANQSDRIFRLIIELDRVRQKLTESDHRAEQFYRFICAAIDWAEYRGYTDDMPPLPPEFRERGT